MGASIAPAPILRKRQVFGQSNAPTLQEAKPAPYVAPPNLLPLTQPPTPVAPPVPFFPFPDNRGTFQNFNMGGGGSIGGGPQQYNLMQDYF